MTRSTLLAGTWDDGVWALHPGEACRERPGEAVIGIAPENVSGGGRGALAIVGGHSLCKRDADGKWHLIATSDLSLVCCVSVGSATYVGTNDAQILRLKQGSLDRLASFDRITGRDKWYAGSALVEGRVVGPPLGIRSMTATCDHAVVLGNVHVGGIPRSIDQGATWQPTIDIDADVHQVCAHPTRPEIVIAAAAVGLCISRDAGASWKVETEGLHAPYCSAVAFVGDDIYVSASTDHFASIGAVYRRALDEKGPLRPVGCGLPPWLEGIVDTDNIAAHGAMAAIADRSGHLYLSEDAGFSWTHGQRLPSPSGLFIY